MTATATKQSAEIVDLKKNVADANALAIKRLSDADRVISRARGMTQRFEAPEDTRTNLQMVLAISPDNPKAVDDRWYRHLAKGMSSLGPLETIRAELRRVGKDIPLKELGNTIKELVDTVEATKQPSDDGREFAITMAMQGRLDFWSTHHMLLPVFTLIAHRRHMPLVTGIRSRSMAELQRIDKNGDYRYIDTLFDNIGRSGKIKDIAKIPADLVDRHRNEPGKFTLGPTQRLWKALRAVLDADQRVYTFSDDTQELQVQRPGQYQSTQSPTESSTKSSTHTPPYTILYRTSSHFLSLHRIRYRSSDTITYKAP
ncbi:hypothetical protein KJE20_07581 [Pyrenophora tritici-repentis]|uniref:Uncharacterized protein n=2 Tax=Pyrenophora tritici-repentis TaxID=45151 RepID=A0A922NAR7_9PLEO|nr:hypothetical protein Ptr86124_007074 [Pyrenophora tritici-repentis]KAI1682849.1 hypothetical protein KJE20_07581 [Pyrenophora tritici-repentis]PZD00144.1 hypothetical protein A1F95_03102 [Pyrenophora tritici-repentis]